MNLTLPKLRELIFEEVEKLFLKEKLNTRKQAKLDKLKDQENKSEEDKEEIEDLEHQ